MRKRYSSCCFRLVPDRYCHIEPGNEFNFLTVLGLPFYCRIGGNRSEPHIVCRCKCGTIRVFHANHVRTGRTKSCGCHQRTTAKDTFTTHGMSRTRLYKIWHRIKLRCYDSKSHRYEDYGGRGIRVCDEWRESFEAFAKWALANGYADNLTIDRRENNGNYQPDNCRWIGQQDQQTNKRKRRDSTTSYKGISRSRNGKRFYAIVQGQYLGVFDTEEQAARAYDAEAKTRFGEFASLNFREASVASGG